MCHWRKDDRTARPARGYSHLSGCDAIGQAVLQHYGLSAGDPESWLYLEKGTVSRDFDAMARVGIRSGGWGQVLRLLLIIPRPLRNWLYLRIARNRYRLFGRADICALPDARLIARPMDGQ